jgi:hypothetical protein
MWQRLSALVGNSFVCFEGGFVLVRGVGCDLPILDQADADNVNGFSKEWLKSEIDFGYL